jgi:UDP-glucose 4-epimerase
MVIASEAKQSQNPSINSKLQIPNPKFTVFLFIFAGFLNIISLYFLKVMGDFNFKNAKILVTGCAGFIGSHLSERLCEEGALVIGVDRFSDYYSRNFKEKNLENLQQIENFKLIEADLLDLDLEKIVSDVDYIFHEAAQAGVRASWGAQFEVYLRDNILATQKLLEACKSTSRLKKFVFASSSSVYGDTPELPMHEDSILKPVSPYGSSKLAAENLCYLYWKNFGVPTVSLRYFTVYGPRQRPDMAFHRFIKAMLIGDKIEIYGDGKQTRDFTYVSDAVNATISAVNAPPGEVFNIGGGSRVALIEIIRLLEEIIGKKPNVVFSSEQKGDVKHTFAQTEKAKRLLGFKPSFSLKDGLEEEVKWLKNIYTSTINIPKKES